MCGGVYVQFMCVIVCVVVCVWLCVSGCVYMVYMVVLCVVCMVYVCGCVYVVVCVWVCGCICGCVCMVVCVCGTLIKDRGHSIGLCLVFEMGSVIGLGLSDPPVSISSSHQFTDTYRHVGVGYPDSEPHASRAGTLMTEPSPKPHHHAVPLKSH